MNDLKRDESDKYSLIHKFKIGNERELCDTYLNKNFKVNIREFPAKLLQAYICSSSLQLLNSSYIGVCSKNSVEGYDKIAWQTQNF